MCIMKQSSVRRNLQRQIQDVSAEALSASGGPTFNEIADLIEKPVDFSVVSPDVGRPSVRLSDLSDEDEAIGRRLIQAGDAMVCFHGTEEMLYNLKEYDSITAVGGLVIVTDGSIDRVESSLQATKVSVLSGTKTYVLAADNSLDVDGAGVPRLAPCGDGAVVEQVCRLLQGSCEVVVFVSPEASLPVDHSSLCRVLGRHATTASASMTSLVSGHGQYVLALVDGVHRLVDPRRLVESDVRDFTWKSVGVHVVDVEAAHKFDPPWVLRRRIVGHRLTQSYARSITDYDEHLSSMHVAL